MNVTHSYDYALAHPEEHLYKQFRCYRSRIYKNSISSALYTVVPFIDLLLSPVHPQATDVRECASIPTRGMSGEYGTLEGVSQCMLDIKIFLYTRYYNVCRAGNDQDTATPQGPLTPGRVDAAAAHINT
jgi:hypothetical protein